MTVGIILAFVLLLWAALHLFITRINPAQETPDGHFTGSCWACHLVSEGANLVE